MKGSDDDMVGKADAHGSGQNPILEEIGRRFRKLREEAGLSQRELGLAADGVSAAYIYLIESGRQNMSLLVFLRLAAALKVSVTELLPDEDIMVDPPSERIFGRLLATEERLRVTMEARRRQDDQMAADLKQLAAASQSIAESIKKAGAIKRRGSEMPEAPARKARPRRSATVPAPGKSR